MARITRQCLCVLHTRRECSLVVQCRIWDTKMLAHLTFPAHANFSFNCAMYSGWTLESLKEDNSSVNGRKIMLSNVHHIQEKQLSFIWLTIESGRRQRSLLYLCGVFQALINSLVCWFIWFKIKKNIARGSKADVNDGWTLTIGRKNVTTSYNYGSLTLLIYLHFFFLILILAPLIVWTCWTLPVLCLLNTGWHSQHAGTVLYVWRHPGSTSSWVNSINSHCADLLFCTFFSLSFFVPLAMRLTIGIKTQ